MSLSIIAAMARNGVIGKNNQLPWHLPEDLKHFKEITMGHPIVMGRKTHESIGRPLPGRENIVLSRNRHYQASGVHIFPSLAAVQEAYPDQEIFIIGGAELYRQAWPLAETLYLTLIEQDFAGDTYFPQLNWDKEFRTLEESPLMTSKQGDLPYRFINFIKAERLSS